MAAKYINCQQNIHFWKRHLGSSKKNKLNIVFLAKNRTVYFRIFQTIRSQSDYKTQYQKFNVRCSFFIHKMHWIIRHITLSKSWLCKTVFNSFTITLECLIRH